MAAHTERFNVHVPTDLAARIRKVAPGGNVTAFLNATAEEKVLQLELTQAAEALIAYKNSGGEILTVDDFGDVA